MSRKDSKSSSTPKLDHIFEKTPAYLVSNLCIVNFKSYSLNNGSAWWQCALCRVINCKLASRKCNTTTEIFGPQQRQERKGSFSWRNISPLFEFIRHSSTCRARETLESFWGNFLRFNIKISNINYSSLSRIKNCTSNNSSLSSIYFKTNKKSVNKEVKFFK